MARKSNAWLLILSFVIAQLFSLPASARNQKPPKNWFHEWDFYLKTSFENQNLTQGSYQTPNFTIRGGEVWLGACFSSTTVQDAKTIVPAIWQIQTQNGPGVARVYATRTIGIPLSGPTDVYWTIVIPPTVTGSVFCSLKKGALIGSVQENHQAQKQSEKLTEVAQPTLAYLASANRNQHTSTIVLSVVAG